MASDSDCRFCQIESEVPPRGFLFQNEYWSVGAHPNTAVPGWLVAHLRRHAPGLVDMSQAELASMGPTLALVARAMTAVLQPERIYFVHFGENYRHVHVVLMPRGAEVPPEHRSAGLHVNSKRYLDPARAKTVAEEIGRAIAEGSVGDG